MITLNIDNAIIHRNFIIYPSKEDYIYFSLKFDNNLFISIYENYSKSVQ